MSTTETPERWPVERPVAKRAFLATLLLAAGASGVFGFAVPGGLA